MKTTLNIDDTVMQKLREESARSGRTMSELVESALRLLLDNTDDSVEMEELPLLSLGQPLVDIADRDALYNAMEME